MEQIQVEERKNSNLMSLGTKCIEIYEKREKQRVKSSSEQLIEELQKIKPKRSHSNKNVNQVPERNIEV